MSSRSSPGAGPTSAASPGAGPVREPRHPLRTAFGVVLLVGWGLLTYARVASTVYLVGARRLHRGDHRSVRGRADAPAGRHGELGGLGHRPLADVLARDAVGPG